MISADVRLLLVSEEAGLRDALAVIDKNARGVAFAVDAEGRLQGLLTDGDIRRALLRGAGLDTPVRAVMRVDCVALAHDAAPQTILAALGEEIAVIPLLAADRRVVDYASHYRHHRLPVTEPDLSGNELNYIMECIKTNWVSSRGTFISRFETEFGRYVGVEHVLAVSSGTAALHLALAALGVGPGDEVIVPDLTFAASANAVLYVGATPVLVDVRRDTWTVDLGAVERAITPRTRALMPVHLYGQPCEMDGLMALARARNLVVVEDAAEALGAVYQGWSVGQFGAAAAFSFFGNKLITTGEGGAVVFRDGAVAERARILRDHGMSPHRRYWHDEVGFNYRLTNLQAAVGLAQLERVEEFIARKVALAAHYGRALDGRDDLVLPAVRPDTRNVFWLYSVVLDPTSARVGRDDLMQRLLLGGIEARPLFYPLHEMPPYRRFAREARYANTEWLSANGLSLPSAVTLKDQEVDYVADAVNRILDVRRIGELAENGS